MKIIKRLADGWMDIMGLEEEYGISKSVQATLRMRKRQAEDSNPLPFSKIGKRILYRRDLIEEWLRKAVWYDC